MATKPGYDDLLELFDDWRAFESPPIVNNAPDYTAGGFEARDATYRALRARLEAFSVDEWPVPRQVDWNLVRAEMNGYDFNRRVLKPWERDPAYYKTLWMARSDVPAHEGPTNHAVVDVWTYEFPLTADDERRLVTALSVIPPLFEQAKQNLTGNARDLWVTGIRDIRAELDDLDTLEQMPGVAASKDLMRVIDRARRATTDLVAWLEAAASSKTGPSGIG